MCDYVTTMCWRGTGETVHTQIQLVTFGGQPSPHFPISPFLLSLPLLCQPFYHPIPTPFLPSPNRAAKACIFSGGGVRGRHSNARRVEAQGPKGQCEIGCYGNRRQAPSPPSMGLGECWNVTGHTSNKRNQKHKDGKWQIVALYWGQPDLFLGPFRHRRSHRLQQFSDPYSSTYGTILTPSWGRVLPRGLRLLPRPISVQAGMLG